MSFFGKMLELQTAKYPRLVGVNFEYGTSGIRTKADILPAAMFRLGVVAVLRSRSLNGVAVGCMVTASHNPACDNGAKLVDAMGEMMEASWEPHVTAIVNASDDEVVSKLESLISELAITLDGPSSIIVGCDTRESSPALLRAFVEGAESLQGCKVRELGAVTTPQLHYVVRCTNDLYGAPSLDGYYEKLSRAFKSHISIASPTKLYSSELTVDAANGVGGGALHKFATLVGDSLKIQVVNDGDGILNHECGADYVKIEQKAPRGLTMAPLKRYASLDGDADRIVYFFLDSEGTFRLLDGDRIAILLMKYIKKLLDQIPATKDLSLGIVQTAYANGSSTDFILNKLGVSVSCVPTGVKSLHREALKFDIGVYFEANGHGSIHFSKQAKRKISSSNSMASRNLISFIDLTNETVGDALSDMLLTEATLRQMDMDVTQWLKEYDDLPSKQIKITVPDRSVIQTTNAARTCTAPKGLQAAIDAAVAKYPKGRSFVRPSGTEDIVRVYAEALGETEGKLNAELLATEVTCLVKQFTCS